jgi:hypothetical protein
MHNTLDHKGNANQNHTEISTQLKLEWLRSITQKTTNAGKDVKKRESFYTVFVGM